MTIEMPVTEARSRLSQVVDMAFREPVHLTRHGQQAVVIISAAEYERMMEAMEDLEDIRAADEAMAEIRAGAPTFTLDEVMAELGLE